MAVPGSLAKQALAGTRFADIRWVRETGSTNSDLLELARAGAPEGVALVADVQTAGRGRQGRSWLAPEGASLLLSVLLRPPPERSAQVTMALAVAAAEAVELTAGVLPRLKWPNDLVWPGDGSAADRKLAGILAEADWESDSTVAVVAGIGMNIRWPEELPEEIADVAIALDCISDRPVERDDLLVALLSRLDLWYGSPELLDRWRELSATVGREVRVELASESVQGVAVDVDVNGHLVLELRGGPRRSIAAGDVVHLRPG